MYDILGATVSMGVVAMAAIATRSIIPAPDTAKQPRERTAAIETLRAAAKRAVAAKEELDALEPRGGGDVDDLHSLPSEGWVGFDIPPSRPHGNWVAWRFRSGFAQVADTRPCAEEIDAFIQALAQPFDPSQDLVEIELQREPGGPQGHGIISVGASVISGGHASYFSFGRLDRGATAWLARSYSSDMPIAAELLRLASDGKRHVAEIACLMPSRGERLQYRL
ncbi:hypothetical protein [Mangrovicoccus sp. HB161399]|uniref:hypothetical protein n=1 Tax=Mangrovicoccus sp. HB161399 TaxID=2720392 RepID=UPI0015541F3F|nr:hypothetical protein [Mangrovicoccus sp. HB161399]